LLDAKLNAAAGYSNSRQYHVLGDPMLNVNPPYSIGSITSPPDSIRALETVEINGDFGAGNPFNVVGNIRILEPEFEIFYANTDYVWPENDTIYYTVEYTKEGNSLFTGSTDVINGDYSVQFIVSADIHSGNTGQVINYLYAELQQEDYLSSYFPLICSSILDSSTVNIGPPQVNLYLESESFLAGDYVSTLPLLIANIEDENGINIVGAAGHKIMLLIDDSTELIDVTTGFVYDTGSFTKGKLTWQLEELDQGYHTITLIVFDNLNNPTNATTYFTSKSSEKVHITEMLPYPNPMEDDGFFTFVLTSEAEITITIYTISGRKINTLKHAGCSAGYNQIYWNGKDGDGDEIANNTYFYKIKAKQINNKKVTEKIGKVIILK